MVNVCVGGGGRVGGAGVLVKSGDAVSVGAGVSVGGGVGLGASVAVGALVGVPVGAAVTVSIPLLTVKVAWGAAFVLAGAIATLVAAARFDWKLVTRSEARQLRIQARAKRAHPKTMRGDMIRWKVRTMERENDGTL